MKKLTDPTASKNNLVEAALFVTAFEMLRSSIEQKISGFLCEVTGFDKKGGEITTTVTPACGEAILDRDIAEVTDKKSDFQVFYASCRWFQDIKAITKDDVTDLQAIRQHRNLIVYQPVCLLVDDAADVNLELLRKAHHLMSKIDKWWLLKIEVPTCGEYNADQSIDESAVNSGMSLLLNYFMEIAAEEIIADTKPSGTQVTAVKTRTALADRKRGSRYNEAKNYAKSQIIVCQHVLSAYQKPFVS